MNLPKTFTYLRYPGGKSKYIKRYLIYYVNSTYTRFIEPFAGGASFTLFLNRLYPHKEYWINDIDYHLYCFWVVLQSRCKELYNAIILYKKEYDDRRVDLFIRMKKEISQYDDMFDIAVAYYILNKTSFSGLTETGNFTPMAWDSNFSYRNIEKLLTGSKYLQDIRISNVDYVEVLKDVQENDFVYLDPPYDLKNKFLYGEKGKHHKGFDHLRLKQCVDMLSCKFVMTYNDNEKLRQLYNDYYIYDESFTYTMNFGKAKKSRQRKEIFITNVDLQKRGLL